MSMSSWFSFLGTDVSDELPEIFPLGVLERDFVSVDLSNIYSKILTDVLERTQGLAEDLIPLLWDNCVQSESADGLVTMLSKAMVDKKDLFIVYDPALKIIRQAKSDEAVTIRTDYAKSGKSQTGVYISFRNYQRTDMLKLYSSLEYCTVGSLSKQMKLSRAVQVKISDLRSSVGLTDSATAKTQAARIADGLLRGRDVTLDAKDMLETAKPDLTATQASMDFIAKKQSFYLGLPESYITGEQSKGLQDTGKSDAKAVERGLKNYYFAIVKPTLEAIFEAKTTFKSEDFEQLSTALEALKTFELTSDELISQDNKREISNKLFGLPADEKGDPPEKVDPNVDPLTGKPIVKAVPAPQPGVKH